MSLGDTHNQVLSIKLYLNYIPRRPPHKAVIHSHFAIIYFHVFYNEARVCLIIMENISNVNFFPQIFTVHFQHMKNFHSIGIEFVKENPLAEVSFILPRTKFSPHLPLPFTAPTESLQIKTTPISFSH